MTTTQAALVPAVVTPDFDTLAVRQAIAGFLAGYGDATRDAYSLDLGQWLGWWASHDVKVFEVKRAHIELFARSLEQDGKARATVARRLSTIAGFYRYCVEEQLIPASPAVQVRRPRLGVSVRCHERNGPCPRVIDQEEVWASAVASCQGSSPRSSASTKPAEAAFGCNPLEIGDGLRDQTARRWGSRQLRCGRTGRWSHRRSAPDTADPAG